MPKKQVVFIIGCGHSGSTLLDMCLGGHSKLSSLGETGFLYLYANQRSQGDLCTCGAQINNCPFWTKVEEELPNKSFKDLALSRLDHVLLDEHGIYRDRLPTDPAAKITPLRHISLLLGSKKIARCMGRFSKEMDNYLTFANNRYIIYNAVIKAHHTPVLIDSSKTPGIVKEAWMAKPNDFYPSFVHIVRDGRAVTTSRIRRLGISMEDAAKVWLNEHKKRELAFLTVPTSHIFTIHYEDLCRDPKTELTKLCSWIGYNFEPAMLDFRTDRHNVGGNPARFRLDEKEITLDEHWKQEISPQDLETFYRITGTKNDSLGYGRSW